jgi:hypothetical protein
VNEVLSLLDMLDVNLTTPADVPALQQLLASHPEVLESAVIRYDQYARGLDLGERRRTLSVDPVYAKCINPTCRD